MNGEDNIEMNNAKKTEVFNTFLKVSVFTEKISYHMRGAADSMDTIHLE